MFAMLSSTSVRPQSSSASPRMQGNLWKWTNYLSGWQQRWFILEAGTLTYYLAPSEVNQGCRGSLKVTSCDIHVHPSDHTRFDIVMPGGRHIYLKASSTVERQQWVVTLGTSKQEEGTMGKLLSPSLDQQVAVKSKMTELQLKCQLLFSQVSNLKNAASTTSPDAESLLEMAALITNTCDSFLKILSECMLLSTTSITGGGVGKAPATPTDLSSPTSSFAPTSLPGRQTHEISHTPSQKPAMFSLSELPAVSHPSHTLPPLLPYPTPLPTTSSKQEKSESSQNLADQVTQSLPLYLVGKSTPPSPGVQLTITEEKVQEKTGHMENGNAGSEREQEYTPSPRTHSRANSDLFMTPTSTPTSSPPPSPSHQHRSLPHTPTSSQVAHTAQTPEGAKSHETSGQPQKIGDRFPRSTVSSNIQSFFSKTAHKFEDLVLTKDDGIPTHEFLESCRAVVPFFDTLSSTAFAPVKADINGNIEKLSQKYLSSPEQFSTLQWMILHEVHTNTHEAKNSATDALLWLKRAMEFIQMFISEVAGGEHSLDIAAGKAYTASLRRYHNWIVRGIFSVAVRAVPYHKDFLVLLGSDGTADNNAAVTVHMADFARSLGEINTIINQFYQSHRLETTPIL